MTKTGTPGGRENVIVRAWNLFWSSSKYSFGAIFISGGIAGLVFWGAYNTAMDLSNTEAFCVSCHEMNDTPYKELKQTIHYTNHIGVRAICSDCHVPKEWAYKFVRKIFATNELFHKILGTVNTPEKFEAKRLEMAGNVWASMRATDSRECRNCHSTDSMDLAKQVRPARKKHLKAQETGQTCIDCHQGIAHELPKGWEGWWKEQESG